MADGNKPLGAGYEITITRLFKAPPELLFDCFVDADKLARWWGPLGCVASEVNIDPRPGGILSLRMAGPGYDHVMGGEYVEIDRPNRIVFLTKAFEAPDGGWGIINRNTVRLERINDSFTRLHLHTHVDRAEGELVLGALGGMHVGWGQQLERLGDMTGGAGKTDFAVKGRQIIVSRAFDAPRDLVWKCITEADRFARWFCHDPASSVIVEWDFRPGGKWSMEQKGTDGLVHTFWGEFTEIDPPVRLGLTQGFDDYAGVPGVYELKEEWGRTTLVRTMTFPDEGYLQGMLSSGFEPGVNETFDNLAGVLATLTPQNGNQC